MTNFHLCLVCNNPSQTDIDGKGNGKRKMNGNDHVQSELKSVFLLEKLLEVSSSTCVDLLRINEGSNPSSWFSCCWNCLKLIEKAEKVFKELIKLEKQWKNLKIAIQTKLHTSRNTELEKSESVILRGKKKIEITVKTIRDQAFKNSNNGFTSPQANEKVELTDIKIEVNEETVNTEPVAPFPDNDFIVGDRAVFLKSKNLGKRKSNIDIPKRTRSGRIVKSKISAYESSDVSSSDEENNWNDEDDYISEHEIRHDNQEERIPKKNIHKIDEYFSKKHQNENEPTKDVTHSEKSIKCKHCGVEFINARFRYLHEISDHESLYKFQCNHCLKKYTSEESLHLHLKKSHNAENNPDPSCMLDDRKKDDVICPNFESDSDCDNNSSSSASINTNKSTNETVVKAPKKLKCAYCPELFAGHKNRYAHEISAHENVHNLNCNHCSTTYLKLDYRNLHLRRYHEGKINPDPSCTLMLPPPRRIAKKQGPMICEECNHDFKCAYKLESHKARIHRKERNFMCEICSKSFTRKQLLKYHQESKHGDSETLKSVQCKECNNRIFCDRQALRKHVKYVHKQEYPYRCPICNVGKQCQSYLDRHILNSHTNGPKPYVCNVCQKSYATTSTLEVHKRTHTGERPFKCPLCNTWFHDIKKMVRHKNSLHADARNFQCEQCGSRFPSQHYLNSHVYSTHNKKKSSLLPKTIMDEQQLAEYVKSTNQAIQEKPSTAVNKNNKGGNGILRKHIEQQLRQKGLLNNDESVNSIEEHPSANPENVQ